MRAQNAKMRKKKKEKRRKLIKSKQKISTNKQSRLKMETKGKQNEKQNKSTFKCKKQGKGSVGGRGEGNTGKKHRESAHLQICSPPRPAPLNGSTINRAMTKTNSQQTEREHIGHTNRL